MVTGRFLLGAAVAVSSLTVATHQATAADGAAAPSVVACIAADTGTVGVSGPQGVTGATGVYPINGPMRVAHMVSGDSLPLCTSLPGVCTYPTQGPGGVQGPTGASGPLPPPGQPRRVHVSGSFIDDYCEGLSEDCWYSVGPQGPTGPVGDTGAPASILTPGPSRRVHGKADLYTPGQTVTLSECVLPTTGGGSTSMFPFALALLGVGVVAVLTGRRRKSVSA